MISQQELKILKNKLNLLEKKDIDLIITDFDDTIFSRKEQLEDNELLRENRGDK
jgi:predicted HAD superfamily phosphohydrolase YqeG